ncbi:MAG: carboxymuconolactone decarboxylase family protein, partial [Chitinophagaceae bacterium]
YITLNHPELPGIVGLLNYRPGTGKVLCELAELLLRSNHGLPPGEREWIASYVSYLNQCHFCHTSHGAAASAHAMKDVEMIDEIEKGPDSTLISVKLRALLVIAGQVQKGGNCVTIEAVENAREAGATDEDVHDTVLIAAAFCMYNRYVDGLHTWAPADRKDYAEEGKQMAFEGYLRHF